MKDKAYIVTVKLNNYSKIISGISARNKKEAITITKEILEKELLFKWGVFGGIMDDFIYEASEIESITGNKETIDALISQNQNHPLKHLCRYESEILNINQKGN